MPPPEGDCGEAQQNRWFFDAGTGSCRQFLFLGCPGVGINFETQEERHRICVHAAGIAVYTGASILPETMMHPPISDFPPIFEKISDFEETFYNFTFSQKISSFSFAQISDDFFLVIDHKF